MNDAHTSKTSEKTASAGNRLAKVIARAGLCSRRQAEVWINAGRVSVNGNVIRTPAFNVIESDKIEVDNKPLASRSGTRVWLYHKPTGLVVSENDPEGRNTIFKALKRHGLPRVLSIGRLDINTEGLLLLTNDGGLKRVLELPATGWLRRYRVRAFGSITQDRLDKLKNGIEVDGIKYGAIDATLESSKGANVWLNIGLREGKNREIKNVLAALGLQVNRLIRVSYGPFQLGDLPMAGVSVVKSRMLREQLGKKLAAEAGVDFESPLPEDSIEQNEPIANNPNQRMGDRRKRGSAAREEAKAKGHTGEPDAEEKPLNERKPAPYRKGNFEYKPRPEFVKEPDETRIVHFGGKRGSEEFVPKAKRKKPEDEGRSFDKKSAFDKKPNGFNKRKSRDDGGAPRKRFDRDDKPRGDRPERGARDKHGERDERGERPKFERGSRPSRSGGNRPKKTRI